MTRILCALVVLSLITACAGEGRFVHLDSGGGERPIVIEHDGSQEGGLSDANQVEDLLDATTPDADSSPLADSRVDGVVHDSTVDTQRPLGKLTLSSASANINCTGVLEPAVRTHGLAVFARTDGASGSKKSNRSTLSGTFGSCASTSLDEFQDATFFDYQGTERRMDVHGSSTRSLRYCASALGTSCSLITVRNIDNTLLGGDFDGPNVADGVTPLQMVFNSGSVLYLAKAISADLLQWKVTEVLPVSGGDPAISSDGDVILYEAKVGGAPLAIYAIYRTADGWSAPDHISALDSTSGSAEPDILTLSMSPRPSYEIFYRVGFTLYHATATR